MIHFSGCVCFYFLPSESKSTKLYQFHGVTLALATRKLSRVTGACAEAVVMNLHAISTTNLLQKH